MRLLVGQGFAKIRWPSLAFVSSYREKEKEEEKENRWSEGSEARYEEKDKKGEDLVEGGRAEAKRKGKSERTKGAERSP